MEGDLMNKLGLILLLLFSIMTTAQAAVFTSGESVNIPASRTIQDDLAAVGGNVLIYGRVNGDVMAAGGRVNTEGAISNNLDVAGGNLLITSPVGHSLRAAGGNITLGSKVNANAFIMGGSIQLTDKASVGRDLSVAGGDIEIGSPITRNLTASGGQIRLSNSVGGDARIQADRLKLLPGAVIRGNLILTSPNKPEINRGARIMGHTVYQAPKRAAHPRRSAFPGWFFQFLMLLVTGLVLYAALPGGMLSAADLVWNWPMSLLTGFLGLIIIPAAAFILLITLIGMPLGFILLFFYLFLLMVGTSVVGLEIGRRILGAFHNLKLNEFWFIFLAWVIGLVLLLLVFLIPFLGGLLRFLALLIGFGALLRAIGIGYHAMRYTKPA